MNTNLNLAAPLGVLAFLGTGLVMTVAAGWLIYSLIVRRAGRARLMALAMIIIGGLYLGAILMAMRFPILKSFAWHVFFGRGSFPDMNVELASQPAVLST